jgi:hypothetical protein
MVIAEIPIISTTGLKKIEVKYGEKIVNVSNLM